MNYNLEQINIIIEKMQKDLEGIAACAILALVGMVLLLLFTGFCVFSDFNKKD